jgi:hypothetical protein
MAVSIGYYLDGKPMDRFLKKELSEITSLLIEVKINPGIIGSPL